MDLAAGNRQAAQRARVIFLEFQHVQHAFAHDGNRADISHFFLFDGFQHFLGVESFMENHRSAEIDDAEGE